MRFHLDEDGLRDFLEGIDGVDMEKVKEESVRRAAEELAERVRQNVVDNDDIDSPSQFHSDYRPDPRGRSPGPSMAHPRAWETERQRPGHYTVSVHPEVRRRAVFLEYGTSPRISPKSADALKFYVNGVPVYADSVSGVEAQGFWREAVDYMRSNNRLKHHAESALEDELEKNGLT